ncbi:cyclic-phosphate processing receiver domain-containing protein [Sphingobacterium sp. DR205]|uniref:cyclic-phosphate processing receiver domain-containing protein n=1 Tax=Sphingobacterium sp. DR205 TaxID=2713573 RepID=UPI0019D05E45|nr:cyclic-phosphate processing receiver domain-containing protein [Sphingobacterium sp. DR205]
MELEKSMEHHTKGIFLDDIRFPSDLTHYISKEELVPYLLTNWTVIRNYQDFVAYISKNGIPSIISFDHDLGVNLDNTEAESGYDAVKYIVDFIIEQQSQVFPQVLCHSQNPVGKANILAYWNNFIKAIDKG